MFISSQWLSLRPSPKSRPDNGAAETDVPEVGMAQELLYAVNNEHLNEKASRQRGPKRNNNNKRKLRSL